MLGFSDVDDKERNGIVRISVGGRLRVKIEQTGDTFQVVQPKTSRDGRRLV